MNGQKLIRELTGLFFVFCGLLILLSLWSYDVKDPTLNQTVSGGAAVKNSAGLFGACLAGLLTDIFGFASYLWALFFLGMGAGLMTRFFILPWYRWFGYLLLAACLLTAAEAWNIGIRDVRGGGILGAWLYAGTYQPRRQSHGGTDEKTPQSQAALPVRKAARRAFSRIGKAAAFRRQTRTVQHQFRPEKKRRRH